MIEIQTLLVKEICESPMNPRKKFEKADIEELAKNIKKQGLLQPITVRPVSSPEGDPVVKLNKNGVPEEFKYEVVCGARRFRAITKLGWHAVQAIVREMTDDEAFDAMITENLQRKDVDPVEEALAFSELMNKGQSAKELAARFGKSERYINDRTKLCSLIDKLKKQLSLGHIPMAGALLLAKCTDDVQEDFYEDYIEGFFESDSDPESVTFQDVRDFIQESFQWLKDREWIDEDGGEAWNDETEVPKCKTCECNTSNHGCLFYEMKGDAKCTNASCFNKKKVVYRKWMLKQMEDQLFKKGEEYTPNKTILVASLSGIYNEDDKKRVGEANEYLKAAFPDVLFMDDSDFSGQCWYHEEDDRLQKLMADGAVVRTQKAYDRYRLGEVKFLYRRGVDAATAMLTTEQLVEKEKDEARNRNVEKRGEAIRNAAKTLSLGMLPDDVVHIVILMHMSNSLGYIERNRLGIPADGENLFKWLQKKENRDDVIYAYVREIFSLYGSVGVYASKLMLKELDDERLLEIEKDFDERLEKKYKKIDEKYKK